MSEPRFTIAAVERDVGLSKDVLRVWERRYGFPAPSRDVHGERLYPAEQVQRLRQVKRLMDQGFRPGRLLALSTDELEALSGRRLPAMAAMPAEGAEATIGSGMAIAEAGGAQGGAGGGTAAAQERAKHRDPHAENSVPSGSELDNLLAMVRRHDGEGFLQAAQQRLVRHGLQHFVQDTVAPLAIQVGRAWETGDLQVFEEHLFTELATRVLRQAIAAVPGGATPRILLTSLPNEQHGLGLLMVEALLSLEGAHCISLGTQMPLLEIVQAARAHRVDAVALSFSGAFPARQVPALLGQLRAVLAPTIELWAGGGGVRKASAGEGILIMPGLDDAVAAVARWRTAHLASSR